MEGSFTKLLILGTFLIIVDVIPKTGSTYYIQEYILVTNTKLTWTDAQSFCRTKYTDLATISSEHDYNVVKLMIKNWTEAFWIGLYDDVDSWRWSLQIQIPNFRSVVQDYRHWQANQPDNAEQREYCASMMGDGFWRDDICWLEKPHICYRDGEGDQYVLIVENKNWYNARNYCRHHHTDLAIVRTSDENQILKSRLQDNQNVTEAWIGLHRDSWKWSNGSSFLFRPWQEHQINNQNNSRPCVTMRNGGWNNWACSSTFNFLCQKITVSETTPAPGTEPATVQPGG
ncbi:C-type mannose receptor 2 isoform X2 [Xyrichtys novacula]|uniref:C-type mannose receptor 2 isoform X2 n=1 Tax=Xyrichtys novacula TaxID=13765 RepID=A0AAV1HJW2_XYRNO|nr:C-type mannose receptor 2 isoform X2 [Xyrichtys novacula]